MTRRLYLGDVNNVSPAWYDVSFWVPGLDKLAEGVQAYGQGAQLEFDLWAEREGQAIPILPKSGMEVLYYDHNGSNPLLHKYLVGGRISADFPLPVPEDKHYRIEVDGFEEDFTLIIPYTVFYQSAYPNDSGRITAHITEAAASYGLKGTWDTTSGVGGPFITYKVGSYNDYNLKSIAYILADISADPGQPTDNNYKVPARRYFVNCQWADPANPGTGGAGALVRVINYYSGLRAAQDPVPLTDRPDGYAYYAYDTFTRANSTSTLGTSETGQDWAALVGTWGINTNRAYLQANAGQNIAVVDAHVADAEVGITAPVVAAALRLAFRVTSLPATGYKWEGFVFQDGGSDYSLYRYQSGVFTLLHTYAVTPANGDLLKVVTSGNTITPYINGVAQASVTDSFNNTATLCGISSDVINTARFDSFYVWAKAARFYGLRVGNDRTAMINIVAIAGPGSDPAPVSWQDFTGTQGGNDGDLTKTTLTDAWDTWASGTEAIDEDGGAVTATSEQARKVWDSFDRTDNTYTLGTAPSGQAWALLGTNPVAGVQTNRGYFASGTGPLYAYVDSGVATCIAQVTVPTMATGARLLFRMVDASNLWFLEAQASSYKLIQRVAGVETVMGTYSVTPASGDIIKVSGEDNVIKFYLNGAGPFITVSDAFNQYATKHGWGTASALTPRFDDFSVWQTYADMVFGIGPDQTLAATASDAFNRADSNTTLGTSDTGQAWATMGTSPVFGIQTNKAYPVSGTGPLYAYIGSLAANGILKTTFSTFASGQRLLFRGSDASNLWYVEAQASFYKIYKRVAGTDTEMASYAATPVAGDVVKVSLDGNAIRLFINDVGPVAVVSDSFNASAGRHGFGTASSLVPRFDDFSFTPLSWTKIAFGWKINAAARTAQPTESGTLVGSAAAYVQGDRFKVAVRPVVANGGIVGYQVRYYKNDVLAFLSTQNPSPSTATPFHAQGAIYHRGATISNVSIKLFSYSIFTNDVSIGKWGPKPHKSLIKRDDLDTREKRQALGDAILARHPDPHQTIDLDTLQEYTQGHIVLLNSAKMGWQNYRQVVASMQRKLKAQDRVLYHLQIGEADIEWLDDDPLGYMLQSQIEDRTAPQPPTNLAASQGVPDSPTTVTHNFTWDAPHGDERWIWLLFSPLGGPAFERRLPAQSGVGVVEGLPAATPYRVRPQYEDWNRNRSDYGTAIDIVTADLARLPAPGSLTQTINQYNEIDDLSQVSWTWTAPADPFRLGNYGYKVVLTQNGVSRTLPNIGLALGISLLLEPGYPYIFSINAIDQNGRDGAVATISGTAAGRVYDQLFNPSFEDIERVPTPLNPKGWLLSNNGGTVLWDTSTASDGNRSIRFSWGGVGSAPNAVSDYFLRVSPQFAYYFEADGKAASAGSLKVAYTISWYDAAFAPNGTTTGGFAAFTTSFVRDTSQTPITPPANTRYAKFTLAGPSSLTNVWIDNIGWGVQVPTTHIKDGAIDGTKLNSAIDYSGTFKFLPGATLKLKAVNTAGGTKLSLTDQDDFEVGYVKAVGRHSGGTGHIEIGSSDIYTDVVGELRTQGTLRAGVQGDPASSSVKAIFAGDQFDTGDLMQFVKGSDGSSLGEMKGSGAIRFRSGFSLDSISTQTGTFTADATKAIYLLNSASAFTANLPAAASHPGRRYTFNNINTGLVTLDGNSSETIGGLLTFPVPAKCRITIFSDGSNWQIESMDGLFSASNVYKSSNQTGIAAATFTKVTWSTEVYDLANDFASDKFTCRIPGYYQVLATVLVDGGATVVNDQYMARIYKNGSTVGEGRAFNQGTGNYTLVDVIIPHISLAATDTLEVYFWHNNGTSGNRDIYGSGNAETAFGVSKVS